LEINTLGNVSEDARRTGDWDWIIGEMEATRQHELDDAGEIVLDSALAAFAILRGEADDAVVDRIVERLNTLEDRDVAASAFELRALLAITRRDWATAQREWYQAVAMSDYNAPYLLPRIGTVAVISRDASSARRVLDEMTALGTRGRAVEADRLTLGAGISAIEGDRDAALAGYRAGLSAYRDLGLAWDEALLVIQAVATLGPDEPEIAALVDTSRTILSRLRAGPILAGLERLLARAEAAAARVEATEGVTPER
jgi:hypothetical protein